MISSIYFTDNYFHLNNSLFYNEYSVILIFLAIAIVLSIIIILLSYMLAVQKPETEKLSTYECGFEPYEDARHTFDVKFYLIAILFIVFDIETMFLIPWTNVLAQLDLVGFWSMIDFMFELSIGYVYIYCIGALDIH
jgi:NADH-quinone oxidoreductase subunit A